MISSPGVLNDADLKTRIVALDSYAIGAAHGSCAVAYAPLRLLSGRSPWPDTACQTASPPYCTD